MLREDFPFVRNPDEVVRAGDRVIAADGNVNDVASLAGRRVT